MRLLMALVILVILTMFVIGYITECKAREKLDEACFAECLNIHNAYDYCERQCTYEEEELNPILR